MYWITFKSEMLSTLKVYGSIGGFLDKDYVKQEPVEEVLKWFITMTCEGLFPNISTLVVVYGYATLHCVQKKACNQWRVFSTLEYIDLFPQPGWGAKTLYVVVVMTLFIQLMEGYFVMEKEEEEA